MNKINEVINKNMYAYIKKDKIFCYLIWQIFSDIELTDAYYLNFENSNNCLVNHIGFIDIYKEIWNPLHIEWKFEPTSHDGRCTTIVNYTNLIVTQLSLHGYTSEAIGFSNFIGYLKSIYIKNWYNSDYFSWLKTKDSDVCKWLYNYLMKFKIIKERNIQDGEELYLYCITGFYLWYASDEEKNAKYKKLILARNERKYRKGNKSKNKNKSRIEIKNLIPEKTYNKLISISQYYQVEEKELLINLIDNEFNEIIK
ncbi:hypothetical protein OA40_18990 [Morganella morganii]|uniref:hypothetical protein n=1 Tax=Morganella morganii TaxID=582 RepID=UPI00062C7C7C|nr:hypothetical protein [Morganella morganii]KKY63294.1 hypothetical protein OA40_18990 [Morganella morganii]